MGMYQACLQAAGVDTLHKSGLAGEVFSIAFQRRWPWEGGTRMTGITTPTSAWIWGGRCWPACSGTSSARSPRMCGALSNEPLTRVRPEPSCACLLTFLLKCTYFQHSHLRITLVAPHGMPFVRQY